MGTYSWHDAKPAAHGSVNWLMMGPLASQLTDAKGNRNSTDSSKRPPLPLETALVAGAKGWKLKQGSICHDNVYSTPFLPKLRAVTYSEPLVPPETST